jgi:protein-disulfide isomerase
MKSTFLICAVALLSLTACNKGKEAAPTDSSASVYKPVPPPADGDWTRVVIATPAGGFMMGNPTAKVHLIEIGAQSCPHCMRFDEAGVTPLIDNYVKTGKVSYEFRNYLLSGLDLAPSLIARCNGPQSFFPLTRALYKDQAEWVGKVQAAPEAQLDALSNLPPNQVGLAWAKLLGLQDWAALRGVPQAKSTQCLTNAAEVDRLVQMTQDVRTQYPEFPGTPSFVINGRMVDLEGVVEAKVWPTVEAKLKESL